MGKVILGRGYGKVEEEASCWFVKIEADEKEFEEVNLRVTNDLLNNI
jgi:hypothetical protein